MLSNTVAIHVGRLLEVRIDAGYRDDGEVDQVFQAIGAEMRRHPGQAVVTVADWRRCPVLAEKAADRLVQRMAGNNPSVERSAALVSPSASIAALQFARLIRETSFDNRRMFTNAAPLITWLSEVLTPAEQERLRAFLDER
jgi:hypothetical protein